MNKSDKYYRFLDKISSIIEPPYFRNMYERTNGGFWDITDEDDQEYILKNIYGDDIHIDYAYGYRYKILNNNIVTPGGRATLYYEHTDGDWTKFEYDDKGNEIYFENSYNSWVKQEYDNNNNKIYSESSSGNWRKWEYDNDGNVIYYESSSGDWVINEYDEDGEEIYFENSDGEIFDYR